MPAFVTERVGGGDTFVTTRDGVEHAQIKYSFLENAWAVYDERGRYFMSMPTYAQALALAESD